VEYSYSHNWREECSQNWEKTTHTWDLRAKVGQRIYIQIYTHTHGFEPWWWSLPREGPTTLARGQVSEENESFDKECRKNSDVVKLFDEKLKRKLKLSKKKTEDILQSSHFYFV
jgi:hypothetical protein